MYDLIIIGAGAAGCSAAIYATRYSLKTLVLSGLLPGGLITEALEVENYPGFLKISGMELANKFLKQAKSLGAEVIFETVHKSFGSNKSHFSIETSAGKTYQAKAFILATGTTHRKINVEGEKDFEGRGVSYCSTCDAPFFRNKIVAVVGGGNSAVEGAQDLAVHAKKVYLIYRTDLKAAPIYIENLRKNPKIVEVSNTNVVKICGDKSVQSVLLDQSFEGSKEIKVDGVFVQIGYAPNNELAKSLGCELSPYGYVKVNSAMETTVKGIFCAGDVNNASNMLHQQVTSASEGAIAAQAVFRFLRGLETVVIA